MKMRLSILLISALLLTLLLTGCGNRQQGSDESVLSSAVQSTETTGGKSSEEMMQTKPLSEEESVQPVTLAGEQVQPKAVEKEDREENGTMKMNVAIGKNTFPATLADNDAVGALMEMMESEPVVIQMSDYAGFEKVGPLGRSLPTSDSRTTTQAGDIVLYRGDQIVIFYGTNSWSYTRIGHIDDLTGWEEALGSGDVTVTFSIADETRNE